MSIKNLNTLSSMLLLLLVSTVSANTVNANTLEAKEQPQSPEYVGEPENYLLSQALGHDEYDGGPQMNWSNYQIGKINAYSGEIISVTGWKNPTSFNTEAPFGAFASSGSYVLIVPMEGENVVVDLAHPYWIGTLIEDYGFRIENDRRSDPTLQERTAPLWRQLGR